MGWNCHLRLQNLIIRPDLSSNRNSRASSPDGASLEILHSHNQSMAGSSIQNYQPLPRKRPDRYIPIRDIDHGSRNEKAPATELYFEAGHPYDPFDVFSIWQYPLPTPTTRCGYGPSHIEVNPHPQGSTHSCSDLGIGFSIEHYRDGLDANQHVDNASYGELELL